MRVFIGFLGMIFLMGLGTKRATAQQRNAPAASGSQQASARGQGVLDGEYRVGPGDILEISVWKEPEVSVPTIVIRPDGKISIPLVNDVLVSDKTPMEIQEMLAQKLEPFIKSANVTVTVREIRSKKIYVLGQIGRPGAYDITQPTTVLQMLTQAGGLLPFAKQKSIYVMRNQSGAPQKLAFNYKDVLKGRKMEQNVLLLPGDTIVVP